MSRELLPTPILRSVECIHSDASSKVAREQAINRRHDSTLLTGKSSGKGRERRERDLVSVVETVGVWVTLEHSPSTRSKGSWLSR